MFLKFFGFATISCMRHSMSICTSNYNPISESGYLSSYMIGNKKRRHETKLPPPDRGQAGITGTAIPAQVF